MPLRLWKLRCTRVRQREQHEQTMSSHCYEGSLSLWPRTLPGVQSKAESWLAYSYDRSPTVTNQEEKRKQSQPICEKGEPNSKTLSMELHQDPK